MADITQLNLAEPDQIEWDDYEPGGEGTPPIPDGKYVLQAPVSFAFDATAERRLRVTLDPVVVVGPTHTGSKIRWIRLSTKRYANRNGSPVGDYLRACGVMASPITNEQYVTCIEATTGRVFQGTTQQHVYCNHKDTPHAAAAPYAIDGQVSIPKNGDGTSKLSFPCPVCQKTVFVNSQVRRFIDSIPKA